MNTPIPRSYWVYYDRLLAGAYPGSLNRKQNIQNITNLIDAGIRCFVNLMEVKETNYCGIHFESYEHVLQRLAKERNIEVSFYRKPIKDLLLPSNELMQQIIDIINTSIFENNEPVYVHCWGGFGRTGTVVGCWLLDQGIATRHNVIELIQELRRDEPCSDWSSPQTQEQINFVLHWVSI